MNEIEKKLADEFIQSAGSGGYGGYTLDNRFKFVEAYLQIMKAAQIRNKLDLDKINSHCK